MASLVSSRLSEKSLVESQHKAHQQETQQKAVEAKAKLLLQQGKSIIKVHCHNFEEQWRQKMNQEIDNVTEQAYTLLKYKESDFLPTGNDLQKLLEDIRFDLNRIHSEKFGEKLSLPTYLPYPSTIQQGVREQKATLLLTGFAEKQYNQLWNHTLQLAVPSSIPKWGKSLLQQGMSSLGIGSLLLSVNECTYEQEKKRYRQQIITRFDGLLCRWRHYLLEQWQEQFQRALYSWYDQQVASLEKQK
ncbi:hypothetical protein F9B85_11020 [Heliorestis acidaminivorans]|uniref:Uncharacterized protein n=1 Tax=Heliorestis acidaminivorans TaxID=553427 RepID=A0A6I0F0I0_9FIRM|nr:hypothetical protein [Heliorestis acidaminivorans]KAB2951815.1 hypothetical protein F9B85_11020 [Heliorestis acidaminivorans]